MKTSELIQAWSWEGEIPSRGYGVETHEGTILEYSLLQRNKAWG